MIYPSEEKLYAPIEWQDCSTGFEDIRYHKSPEGIAKLRLIAQKCVMLFVHKP